MLSLSANDDLVNEVQLELQYIIVGFPRERIKELLEFRRLQVMYLNRSEHSLINRLEVLFKGGHLTQDTDGADKDGLGVQSMI